MKLRKRIAHICVNHRMLSDEMHRKVKELQDNKIPIIRFSKLTRTLIFGEEEHYYFTQAGVHEHYLAGYTFNEIIPNSPYLKDRIVPYKEVYDQE